MKKKGDVDSNQEGFLGSLKKLITSKDESNVTNPDQSNSSTPDTKEANLTKKVDNQDDSNKSNLFNSFKQLFDKKVPQ